MSDAPKTLDTQILRNERTEAALRLSEATKTAILETALDCIITIDCQGIVLDWNPAAERTFGYSLREALGHEMSELIIPARFREMHRGGLARAVETGTDVLKGRRLELSAVRKNGEEFPVELAITRIAAGLTPLFTGHIRDISERKKAEWELQESQRLLSSITQNITEAIFRRSVRDGLLFVNDAYVKMFGYTSAAEVRQVPAEGLYAEPRRRREVVERLTRAGEVRDEEIEYRRKDGTTFWGLTSATGIRDGTSGGILYFDGAIHDITERKQTEQRQAAQYAVVRALADSTSLAEAAPKILAAVGESLHWDVGTIWQVTGGPGALPGAPRRRRRREPGGSPAGQTTDDYRELEKSMAAPAQAAPEAMRCVDLWHRPGLRLERFIMETRRSILPRGIGLPGRIWKTAEPAWISDVLEDANFPRAPIAATCGLHAAFGFPICLGQRILGVIEFFSREIRRPEARLLEMFSAIGSQIGQFIERKRAEEGLRSLNKDLEQRVRERTTELVTANGALRESESRYRTVAERTPAAIVVLDTEAGRFTEVNENAVRLFGMSREALLQVGPAEVSPAFQPDGQLSLQAARQQIAKALAGSTPIFEWVHRRGDGAEIPCEVRVARMPAAGRELVIGAITDITARKQAEAELRTALEQEKELNQLKSNFVSVVSHEFRTPLGVILSGAEILENYFERLRPEQRAGHLQDIRHATRQMTELMEEVLLLGKVESGKMECKPEWMELRAFCRRLVEEQCSATGGKCRLTVELTGIPARAWADEAMMRHIFTNLLSNAVKYSPAGSPVRFSVRREGATALFEVEDHGIGIPAEDQKALYEAFHRGRNVGDIPGTGLGMVIAKRCVEAQGGTIEFASAVGHGTTFRVRLKAFPTEPPAEEAGATASKGGKASPRRRAENRSPGRPSRRRPKA